MELINTIMSDSPLSKLLHEHDNCHVGYVYSMHFSEVLVLVNDAWKEKVGGIPHNCFLIATALNPEKLSETSEFDKEIVLLRVNGPASLPQDPELLKARIEHNQRRTHDEKHPAGYVDGLDPLTLSELQYGGLKCRILGTFYMEDGKLHLGSDVENYMCSTRLRVFKPHKDALENIVNHINPEVLAKAQEEAKKSGFKEVPKPIEIGTVRYTSTARLHRRNVDDLVHVLIQPSDFLARRTAILGMTRTGKSNTVKTMMAAVALAANKDSIKIGQIIFDINGEYANANHQDDGSSIADVFKASCIRYRAMETKGFEDLRFNFYSHPAEALKLLHDLAINDPKNTSTDIEQFLTSSLEEPEPNDFSELNRWQLRKAIFQCILYKAGYKAPNNFKVSFPVSATVAGLVAAKMGEQFSQLEKGKITTGLAEASIWFITARALNSEIKKKNKTNIGLASSSKGSSWFDTVMEAFVNVLAQKSGGNTYIRGYRILVNYIEFHSNRLDGAVEEDILKHLTNGKIVIIDLSVGPVEIRNVLSERIARKIFESSFSIMNKGETPPHMVIYVEEAHNIIGKKDELNGTWPRIAKEGAKARIAFVYATQEPSSLHPNILANTENWFVSHLNNDDELRTLAKFYDFGDFVASLKSAQNVGFVRMKTLSSPFVVPTQIYKFEPQKIIKSLQNRGDA